MKHRTVITMTAAAGLAISRPPIHAPEGRGVVLRDGSTVLIRPVRSADTSLLADGFARLSAASRQMRFLSVKKELSTADLRYFTDVDHHDHEALAALDQAAGHGLGIARYIRDAGEYTYTIELTGAEKIDDEHYTAINHLEGDFPGGVVDLHFRFTLRDGRIARLVIGA